MICGAIPNRLVDRRMLRSPASSCCASASCRAPLHAGRALGPAGAGPLRDPVEHDPEHHDRETRGQALPEEVAPGVPAGAVVPVVAGSELGRIAGAAMRRMMP